MEFSYLSKGRKRRLIQADVAELVDALALGASAARCGGSSPLIRTTGNYCKRWLSFYAVAPSDIPDDLIAFAESCLESTMRCA